FAVNEKVLSKPRIHVSESEPGVARGQQDVPEGVLPRTSPQSFQQLRRTHRLQKRPEFDHIVLLLQGGGALGAYQAGVYEALAEADLHPDWVAGISIGSINGAIIAGNPPNLRVEKLREFWEGITSQPFDLTGGGPGSPMARGDVARGFLNQINAAGALVAGAPG